MGSVMGLDAVASVPWRADDCCAYLLDGGVILGGGTQRSRSSYEPAGLDENVARAESHDGDDDREARSCE
jgi:hypothetical protein